MGTTKKISRNASTGYNSNLLLNAGLPAGMLRLHDRMDASVITNNPYIILIAPPQTNGMPHIKDLHICGVGHIGIDLDLIIDLYLIPDDMPQKRNMNNLSGQRWLPIRFIHPGVCEGYTFRSNEQAIAAMHFQLTAVQLVQILVRQQIGFPQKSCRKHVARRLIYLSGLAQLFDPPVVHDRDAI